MIIYGNEAFLNGCADPLIRDLPCPAPDSGKAEGTRKMELRKVPELFFLARGKIKAVDQGLLRLRNEKAPLAPIPVKSPEKRRRDPVDEIGPYARANRPCMPR